MITSLLIGAAVGAVASKLGIKTEVILGTGLVVGAVTGTLSLPVGLGIMGACVVSGVKDLLRNTHEEASKPQKTELDEIAELFNRAPSVVNNSVSSVSRVLITEPPKPNTAREVRGGFISHISTLIILAPVVVLLATIPGLNTFIYPISVITIVIAAYLSLNKNNAASNLKNIAGLGIVGSLALYSLLNVSSGGSFLYFLSLISIPTLLIKDKIDNTKQNNSLFNIKNNFLYGNSGATLPIIGGAVALLQTIIMGSGQDMLGTLINGDLSVLLDPYRLSILAAVLGITSIYGVSLLRKDEDITDITNSFNNNNSTINKIAKIATVAASATVIATQFNPVVGIAAVCAGLTAKLLLKNNTNKVAIASLLIIGGLTSF